MNKPIYTFLAILFVCNLAFTQEINCIRKAQFGSAEICLPQIDGYQESYTDVVVKELADGTEVPANMVLGFYLNNETFERKDSLGLFSFDDFFKVYGTKQIKDYKADYEILKQMKDVLGGNFISKNWELMEKEIDEIGMEIEIGVPTVIKTYNLNDRSFTYVMLTQYDLEGVEPYTMAMTMNGLLINERLIWMAYYLNYNGAETVGRLQERSNTIVNELLKGGK